MLAKRGECKEGRVQKRRSGGARWRRQSWRGGVRLQLESRRRHERPPINWTKDCPSGPRSPLSVETMSPPPPPPPPPIDGEAIGDAPNDPGAPVPPCRAPPVGAPGIPGCGGAPCGGAPLGPPGMPGRAPCGGP
eukprot:8513-Prymnesium_polylepis.2